MTKISEDRQFLSPAMFPDRFDSEDHLEDFMSTPSRALFDDMNKVEGDILILGVAGKMGPTLARLAKRAAPEKRIVGVARFSDATVKQRLESWGIETHVADLLDRDQVQGIPKLPNIVYMAGKKFGTAGMESFTWAMNTYVPALVGEAFPNSRIVVFSTILVYPSSSIVRQGCTENDPPYAAPGEYANSCVGRERSFEFFSIRNKAPMRGFRLCYSQDMRYGVFHEVATKVFNDQPIDLSAGHVNAIWQGDANSQALRSLRHCTVPMSPINIAGAEVTNIHDLAISIGHRMGKEPRFVNTEVDRICLVNGGLAADLFGYPVVPSERIVTWIADWVSRGMTSWEKPTHYDTLDGVY